MDNSPNWTKIVAKAAPIAPQHPILKLPLNNWVRGDHGWFNLNHFLTFWVKGEGNEWTVMGALPGTLACAQHIKTFDNKEEADAWLNKIMGGLE